MVLFLIGSFNFVFPFVVFADNGLNLPDPNALGSDFDTGANSDLDVSDINRDLNLEPNLDPDDPEDFGDIDISTLDLQLSENLQFALEYFYKDEGEKGITGTLLPATTLTVGECERLFYALPVEFLSVYIKDRHRVNTLLGCGIKTGNISLWMVPYYIRSILEFVISLAGLVAVGGVVSGGFLYLFAGVSDDKEKGKKAILYGVIGFVITLISWALVNIVVSFVSI